MITQPIDRLREIAIKAPPEIPAASTNNLVQESVEYLKSSEAAESISFDPYWPKWNSPWWHILLLQEMGLTSQTPSRVIDCIVDALDKHYLHFFPLTEEDVPTNVDPLNQVSCHCQLGTMAQLLTTYGTDLDRRLPWIRGWYLRYQIGDGGLNCDEAAYTKSEPKSSVVSTLPPLEAVLQRGAGNWTPEEIAFLDRGADYLIKRRLYRKTSSGQPIDVEWLKLSFPRFYFYDVLRGLSFLLSWSKVLNRKLPVDSIEECIQLIDSNFPNGVIHVQRSAWSGMQTRYMDRSDRTWKNEPASTFPLLEQVGQVGHPSEYLTNIWTRARQDLKTVIESELVICHSP